MIALIVISGIIFYVFGAFVTFRICNARWGRDCVGSYDDEHVDCGHLWGAIFMGVFWLAGPVLYLFVLALWHLAVVVSDMFTPKEDK